MRNIYKLETTKEKRINEILNKHKDLLKNPTLCNHVEIIKNDQEEIEKIKIVWQAVAWHLYPNETTYSWDNKGNEIVDFIDGC